MAADPRLSLDEAALVLGDGLARAAAAGFLPPTLAPDAPPDALASTQQLAEALFAALHGACGPRHCCRPRGLWFVVVIILICN